MSWADGMAALQRGRRRPGRRRAARPGGRERRPRGAPVPLEFMPDMPGPAAATAARALTDDELDQLVARPAAVAGPRRRLVRRRGDGQAPRRGPAPPRATSFSAGRAKASLVTRLAPAAATSRRIAWSLVTTTTGRSTGVPATSARMTSSAVTPVGEYTTRARRRPRGVGADDVGAVEHDGDVGAVAAGDVVDEVEAAGALAGEVVVGPGPAWRRCSRRPARARRAPAAGARSPAGSRGRRRPAAPARPARPGATSTSPPRRSASARADPGEVAQLADLGAGDGDAAALGAVGEQGVALGLGRRRPLERRVALGLDAGEAPPRRLGPVVGVAGRQPGLGELRPQGVDLGRHAAGGAPLLVELPDELVEPGLPLHELGARPDRRLLGRLPPPLGPPQGGGLRRLRGGGVGRRDELGDPATPSRPPGAATRCRSGRPARAGRRRRCAAGSRDRPRWPGAASRAPRQGCGPA